jgi:hypothetical protein
MQLLFGIAALGLAIAAARGNGPLAELTRAPARLLDQLSDYTAQGQEPSAGAASTSVIRNSSARPHRRPVEMNIGSALVHVPPAFESDDGLYDVIVHFHGAPQTVEPAFDATGISAVLVLVNVGISSGPYEQKFADAQALDRMLVGVQSALNRELPGRATQVRRIAISGWSAGYGAVLKLLSHESIRARVDAVLLEDGMHAGYAGKHSHDVDPVGMDPFTSYARSAAAGDKLMSITHSAIRTSPYASTTETAAFLVSTLGAPRQDLREQGPGRMVMTTRADLRGFHVRGYEGGNAEAHCDHLYGIGHTVFADLRGRWTRP